MEIITKEFVDGNQSNYVNLIDSDTKVKVSTVQNNNSAEFGKQFMFDNNEDTSWYSDQGKFQYVFCFFDNPVKVEKIELTCSGGFCPKVLSIFIFMK